MSRKNIESRMMHQTLAAPKHCPECLASRGEKKKVKTYQINLEGEGVVMCEEEQCSWPFRTEPKEVYMVTVNKEELPAKKKKQKA